MKMKLLDMRDYVSIHKKQSKTQSQTTAAATKQTSEVTPGSSPDYRLFLLESPACPQLTGQRDGKCSWTSCWLGPCTLLAWKWKELYSLWQMLWSPSESEAPRKSRAEIVCFGKWFPSFLVCSFFCDNFWAYCSFLEGCWRSTWNRLRLCGWLSWPLQFLSLMVFGGLRSLMILSSVLYASDTDQCAHFKVIQLWILYFHGSLYIQHAFLYFTEV